MDHTDRKQGCHLVKSGILSGQPVQGNVNIEISDPGLQTLELSDFTCPLVNSV